MPKLLIVIASTRPGRVGLPVGQWVRARAEAHGGFDVAVADLAELNLPLLDERAHPRLRQYTREHTHRWSAMVDAADAVVFVMPEYNFSITAPLKNAIDYLYHEWLYKPLGLVSYGGASGGVRAAHMARQIAPALKMMPLPEGVAIAGVGRRVVDGAFQSDETLDGSASRMFDELVRWESALRTLRQPAG